MTDLTNRQLALYFLVLAEATSLDERLMMVSTLAKQIRATAYDALVVREALVADLDRTTGAGS